MDVTAIDRSATQGHTALHRAAARSKIVAALLVIASVVLATDPFVMAGVALALVAVAAALRLPMRTMLSLALYPALFALIFSFAAATGPVSTALIVLKATTAALAMVVLILTTPYPQVFAPIQRVTPAVVGDSLFLTYRSLFILAEKQADLSRAIRLRAGVSAHEPVRSAKVTTRALGGLLLYSLDLARRDYDILRVRGYEGRLRIAPQKSTAPVVDVAAIAFGMAALALAIAFRAVSLLPYSWIPALASLISLFMAITVGRRRL